ncbi:hypothetical protein ACLOJK_037765 [Asimina triloba]
MVGAATAAVGMTIRVVGDAWKNRALMMYASGLAIGVDRGRGRWPWPAMGRMLRLIRVAAVVVGMWLHRIGSCLVVSFMLPGSNPPPDGSLAKPLPPPRMEVVEHQI